MMAGTDIYPDDDNIFERIAEIQQIIVTQSTSPKTPIASVDNFPYWLMVVRAIPTEKGVDRQSFWNFEIAMTLYREKANLAQIDYGVMSLINSDMINTVKQFELRRNLWTPTYPTTPLGLVPQSLTIQCEGYTQDAVGTDGSEIAGSFYVLQFQYEIRQSIEAVEGTKTA
jgi:hypothetical protein